MQIIEYLVFYKIKSHSQSSLTLNLPWFKNNNLLKQVGIALLWWHFYSFFIIPSLPKSRVMATFFKSGLQSPILKEIPYQSFNRWHHCGQLELWQQVRDEGSTWGHTRGLNMFVQTVNVSVIHLKVRHRWSGVVGESTGRVNINTHTEALHFHHYGNISRACRSGLFQQREAPRTQYPQRTSQEAGTQLSKWYSALHSRIHLTMWLFVPQMTITQCVSFIMNCFSQRAQHSHTSFKTLSSPFTAVCCKGSS